MPIEVRARAAQRLIRFSGLDFNSVFFVNSGAEANENALKMAFTITRRRTSPPSSTASTAAPPPPAPSPGARPHKWYGFPRTPFDVSFIPRRDHAAIAAQVSDDTAAVIVEPVQGVGGAFDLGAAVPCGAARALRCRSARC